MVRLNLDPKLRTGFGYVQAVWKPIKLEPARKQFFGSLPLIDGNH